MRYIFYQIGVDDSDLNTVDLKESFSMDRLKRLSERHKKQMIELFHIIADDLETGVLSNDYKMQ